jgi:ABC-type transport system substrate-binding protein
MSARVEMPPARRPPGRAGARAARTPNALWSHIYRELETAAPAVPLVNGRSIMFVSKRVGNYQHHPLCITLVEQVWVH